MPRYNGVGESLSKPVVESLVALKNYIAKYDPLEYDCHSDILLELAEFRKGWRKLTVYFDEIYSEINGGIVNRSHENDMCIGECINRENSLDIISKNSESFIIPSFEMNSQFNVNKGEDSHNESESGNCLLDKAVEMLELDLQRRLDEVAETESSCHSSDTGSVDFQEEELEENIDSFRKSLEKFTKYLDNFYCEDNKGFCPVTFLELHNNLRMIYLYLNSLMDRVNYDCNGEVINVYVNENDKVISIIDRPLSEVVYKITKTYPDFLTNIFPIRIEFYMMNSLSNRKATLLSVFLNTDKPLKYDIFSDILFDRDNGEHIQFIDQESFDILPKDPYGRPYYWLQYFVNNKDVIPRIIKDISVDPNDLFRIIEYRIQNFVIFNLILYLASLGPEHFVDFILFYLEVGPVDTTVTQIVMDDYNFNLINENNYYSFTIRTDIKDIYVEIKLSGNMGYCTTYDEFLFKEEFIFIENEFSINNLVYNRSITTNFCKTIYSALLHFESR